MDDWWKVIVLGIVEGLTEFLPISSTGHLLIAERILDYQSANAATFTIFIQLGAVLAVVVYYARALLAQAREITRSSRTRHFWLAILIAMIPASVVGLIARKWIKEVLFASPNLIAWSLIIGGIILILIEKIPRKPPTIHEVEDTSYGQALGIGAAQMTALVPGVSRSGASIVGGMLGGLDRETATAFSFYLAIPTLGAATLVDLAGSFSDLKGSDYLQLALGLVVAFIVALLSIGWLLRYVAHHTFVGFGVYRIIAGILILVLGGFLLH